MAKQKAQLQNHKAGLKSGTDVLNGVSRAKFDILLVFK